MSSLYLAAVLVTAATPQQLDFDTDIVPILTKAGCNAAACHGAASGRGGFKLSLFGGDPSHDIHAIVHQLEGRRVNLSQPDRSLVVLKPTGELDHGGEVRLDPDGRGAEKLISWIRAGAARKSIRQLSKLVAQPSAAVVSGVPSEVQLNIQAFFDDGTQRDVTGMTVFYPADPAAVDATADGKLTIRRRGQHTVVIRYLSTVQTVRVTAPLADEPINLADHPRKNWIDDEVYRTLETLRLPPSELAGDAHLLRRLWLDLAGRLPTPEQARRYLSDRDPMKYEKLVDRLLRSPQFTEYWTYKLAKLLRIRGYPNEKQPTLAFHNWLRDQIQQSRPLDTLAVSLVTSEGDTHSNGPANFYRVVSNAREQAEYFSELLMGVRLRCANCHNHPLDQWTQDDYHGLAAVFAKIERGRVISLKSRGEVTHPRTGQAAVPRIPGQRFLDDGDDGRQALAQWLTDPDNPYFARAMVNRFWKAMLGRGLIEPTDDLRATNPATHPVLLDRLTKDFIEHGFDVRHTLRMMATSATYARSSQANEKNRGDDRFYSHSLARPLEPEVLADAIDDVSGITQQYTGQPKGMRAIALFDPRTPSDELDILGRCNREESCEATEGSTGGLTTKLHLINGKLINRKITALEGRLHGNVAAGLNNDEIVEEFYLSALGRFPSGEEQEYWKTELAADSEKQRLQKLEDFVWSLLTCREFSTNH